MQNVKYLAWLCALVAVLHGCVSQTGVPVPGSNSETGQYTIQKQIRYGYTLRNTSGNVLENAHFSTYAPVRKTSHQIVKTIHSNLPYRKEVDALGNQLLHFNIESIPPYGAKLITITVDLMMSDSAVSEPVGDIQRFTQPEPFIESSSRPVSSLAKSLLVPVTDSTINPYKWIRENIVSETYVSEDRGALYALENRTGDCTEFAYLLTAIYRAQGIPSRPVGGYVFKGNDIVKGTDYHNWTEFHIEGAWQIADAQKGAFQNMQSDYVAMRRIAPDRESTYGSQRFFFVEERLEVTMN